MNECKRCGKAKSLDAFYKRLDKEARCKECVSELRRSEYKEKKEFKLKAAKKYRDENPEKIRDTKLKQAYGVGIDYFNAKLEEQGGVCAGCKRNIKTIWRGKHVAMALDHNHDTKQVRGVLCIKCNRALGLLEENEKTFLNLIDYINKYKKLG
jgi:hypothetical protein